MPDRDALFETPPEGFVAARDALVKELRAQGLAAEAREVAALRRPTPAVWALNQVARHEASATGALLQSTQALKRAQGARGTPDELREAMQAHRDALAAVTRAAEDALRKAGHDVAPALSRRIADTAQGAALADPERLRTGTLLEERAAAGFGALVGDGGAPIAPGAAAKHAAEDAARAREAATRAKENASRAESDAARLEEAAARAHEASVRAHEAAAQAKAEASRARAAARHEQEIAARALALAEQAESKAQEASGASRAHLTAVPGPRRSN